jgi:hypothetical protein
LFDFFVLYIGIEVKPLNLHEYPVIYYRPDPEYSRVLITPENFKKFDEEFPAHLDPIYQKYWNCNG